MDFSKQFDSDKERLEAILSKIRHWLPQQGPIQVFIHHNTLHALEDLPFEEAVEYAARVRNTEPYLSHSTYLREYAQGRIDLELLNQALSESLENSFDNKPLFLKIDRLALRRILLLISSDTVPASSVHWILEEKSDLSNDELRHWKILIEKAGKNEIHVSPPSPTNEASEKLVSLAASYFDQGISYWPMPEREKGFLSCFQNLWKRELKAAKIPMGDAFEVILSELKKRAIPPEKMEEFLQSEALALPGWSGIFSTLESRPHLLEEAPPASLLEFLAVRLCLQSLYPGKSDSEVYHWKSSLAYQALQALKALHVSTKEMLSLKDGEWTLLLEEIHQFGDIPRRRIFQRAYELHFNNKFLGALLQNAALNRTLPKKSSRFQAVFCIDDREESLRRHIEEVSTEFATYGVAGFFGVDMWYQGLGDRKPVALCPVMITPRHYIRETAIEAHAKEEKDKLGRLHLLRSIGTYFYDHSRNLVLGWWVAAIAGAAASIPLFIRVLFPKHSGMLGHYLAKLWFPSVETDLAILRDDKKKDSEPTPSGLLAGFNLEEMALRVENILKAIGLTSGFTPLVFILGHGSTSLNNPHESAYDCGACGGGRGGPNARAFARMANLPTVRQRLSERGIQIPSSTYFVGGFHDTASDSVVFFDTNRIPESHTDDLMAAEEILEEARTRDAHERCRRFESARGISITNALAHVEGRCRDLREPRPECGHATNGLTIVGRRNLSQYLFLDRRSFLASYDSSIDTDGKILAGILGAVIPVCAGISLEYYFSFVDNEGYGCGTKLPHNITSLIGVMNGRCSDLRTGLPWQMVEIHEPVRNLFIIEAERSRMEQVLKNNPAVQKLVKNHWVQVALIHPTTGEAEIFYKSDFVPYQVTSPSLKGAPDSLSYYQGKLHHLWPVRLNTVEGSR